MSDSDLQLLPPELARLSVDEREIALPYPEVLAAIDHLERSGVQILGWEALLSSANGAPPFRLLQGSADLSKLTKADAAAMTRSQIQAALSDPYYSSNQQATRLYFIITVAAA